LAKEDHIIGAENGLEFYVLSKINSPFLSNFYKSVNEETFWIGKVNESEREKELDELEFIYMHDNPLGLWYLLELGLKDNEVILGIIEKIKNNQTIQGDLPLNDYGTAGHLMSLVCLEPKSEHTKNAATYIVQNWQNYKSEYPSEYLGVALSVLALSELNFNLYRETIQKMAIYLKEKIAEMGFVQSHKEKNKPDYNSISSTSLIIIALSRVIPKDDDVLKKAMEWLKSIQRKNGSWDLNGTGSLWATADAVWALISMGEGPKISLEEITWNEKLRQQKTKDSLPYFVHTSPLYNKSSVREIMISIKEMMPRAKKMIRISSLYLDVLYEDLIELSNQKPELQIRIITRPPKDIRGLREKIAKNVLSILSISTKGNLRINELMHSRMLIIDDEEILISTADLTRDQLYDEFNAGIYTKNKQCVKKSIEFFDNVWNNSEKLPD